MIFLFMVVVYIVVNAVFAVAYMSCGDCVENSSGSFFDSFSFSVQTMATIGYGKMSPVGVFANMLVIAEAIAGTAANAVICGIIFSKFARPTARVSFSKVATITYRDGIPSVLFRIANERNNLIVETHLNGVMARDETTKEGESVRRFYDLHFSRDHNLMFALTWTAIHPIDKDSPLFGLTLEDLATQRAEVVLSLTGMDSTSSATIYARHAYNVKELVPDVRLVDILSTRPDGVRQVDFTKFHDVVPVAEQHRLPANAPLGTLKA
jgi:inward rectifier potassium channel